MANAWLRLWHDMPNDPKWRTIARVSGQPIATVMAVYIHLLVSASRNVTRGHIDVTTEDLASALDVTEEVIDSILQTMQGRVPDGEIRRYDRRHNMICTECRKSEVMQRILSFYQGDVRYLLK